MEEYWGRTAGLGTALAWAVSSLIFSRVKVPAAALNLFKNSFSALFLLLTLAILRVPEGIPLISADDTAWVLLSLSSVVGLVLGDTCYFRSLQILGPRRALVLVTISPPLTAILGWLLLQEPVGAWSWVGMAITLAGVAWVVLERTTQEERW